MLKLNRNGYIAHLLVNYGADLEKYTRDLCGVIRGLGIAFMVICTIIIVSVAASILLFAWVVPLLAYGFTDLVWSESMFTVPFVFLCVLCGTVLVDVSFKSFSRWREDRRYKSGYYDDHNHEATEPSLFAVWYDGFKNKYCPRVEFVDKD